MKFGLNWLRRKSKPVAVQKVVPPMAVSKSHKSTIGERIRNPLVEIMSRESFVNLRFLESEPALELSITPKEFTQLLPTAKLMTGKFNEKGEPDENGEYFFAAMVKFRYGVGNLDCRLFFVKQEK